MSAQAEERKPFTTAYLDSLQPGPKRKDYADVGCRGLTLAVLPSGSKAWFYRYRNADGLQRSLPLGLYNAERKEDRVSLADARKARDVARAAVLAGGDPAAAKAMAREAAAAEKARMATGEVVKPGDTFGTVWKRFAETYLLEDVKPGTKDKWEGICGRVLKPRWESKPLNKITADDVTAMVWSMRKTPHAADSARILCRVFFDWCINAKVDDTGKPQRLIDTNPAADVAKVVEKKKNKGEDDEDSGRPLSDSEVRALWIATEDSPQFGNMVRLLLLTGTRRNEVAECVWDEFDLQAGTWKIPGARTKNGKTHTIFLSAEALAVIADVPKIDGAELLFPSNKGDTPLSGFSKMKARLDAAMAEAAGAKLEPWKLHDLRRTFATGLARLGVMQTVTARCLNHTSEGKQTALDRIYNRHDFAPQMAEAWKRWGAHVAAVVSGAPSNVVPLVPLQGETVPA